MRRTLLLHGGAGSMAAIDDSRAARYRQALREAADVGGALLAGGEGVVEAVLAAVEHMENSGIFNAGLGSCLTSIGTVEMDAAVMDGSDRSFGAVAAAPQIANPVRVARAVSESTRHCLLAGPGVVSFALDKGFHLRTDFPSEARKEQWLRKKAQLEKADSTDAADHLAAMGGVLGEATQPPHAAQFGDPALPGGDRGHDTVGACAIDLDGSLAAAVSTGGLWLKLPGRVGDSPLPGGGLWADNGAGVAVATGTGESILRCLFSKDVVDRMGRGAQVACDQGLAELKARFGPGQAGVIALDAEGQVGLAFDTRGMGRALWREGIKTAAVAIWPGEAWDRPIDGP